MGVDLALECLELHGRCQLLLVLELPSGDLGGEQIGESARDALLGRSHLAGVGIVELQGANHVVGHDQGNDDRSIDDVPALGKADFLGSVEHLHLARFDDVMGRLGANGRPSGVQFLIRPGISQDVVRVGNRHRNGIGCRKQQVADLLGAVGVQALGHGRKGAARQIQHGIGLACADAVGIEPDTHGHDQAGCEDDAWNDEQVARRRRVDEVTQKQAARKHVDDEEEGFQYPVPHLPGNPDLHNPPFL